MAMVIVHSAVFVVYGVTVLVVHAARWVRAMVGARRVGRPIGQQRMLVAGTFYNVNWFRSHVFPLAASRSLCRVYVVTDAPLGRVDPRHWRELLAWVPQQPYLFHGTVAQNIRLARPGASLDAVRQAARLEFHRQPQ